LQGEIHKDPAAADMDVELLLEKFLSALLEEQAEHGMPERVK
jgi:hypothetical protein